MLKYDLVKLKATGHFWKLKNTLAYGNPLFQVVSKKTGKIIYPDLRLKFNEGGNTESTCKNWIKNNCIFPGDKIFPNATLEKLMNVEEGESYEGFNIIKNTRTYEGNRHDQFKVIFQESNEFFSFPYFMSGFGTTQIGQFSQSSEDPRHITKEKYLCRKVHRKEKQVTVVNYQREFSEE